MSIQLNDALVANGVEGRIDTLEAFDASLSGAVVTLAQYPAATVQAQIVAACNALTAMGGGKLLINSDITLTNKASGNWKNVTIDAQGHTITWAGPGANSLFQGSIEAVGSLTGVVGTVASDSPAYSNAVTLVDASAFSIGDVIYIDSASTVSPGLFLNVVAKVVSKIGNTLVTNVECRIPIVASEGVTVTKVNAAQNFWIENANFVATGQTSRAAGMGAMYMAFAVDSGVKNVSAKGFWFKGLKTTFCENISTQGLTVSQPAAVGGGEGYGLQYEYTYNSNASRLRGLGLRHVIDHTAAWHCNTYDSVSTGATDADYNLHSAYEYDISYTDCQSYAAAGNAFALGGTGTGFADFVDKVSLNNCTAKGCQLDAIKFASGGKGLTIFGGEFSPGLNTKYSIVTSMSDVQASLSTFTNGVQVASGAGLPTDGKVRFDICNTTKATNTRSILLGTSTSAELYGCSILGQITLAANAKLKIAGGQLLSQNSTDQIFSVTPSLSGQEIYFSDMKISTSAVFVAAGYTFTAAKIIFDNVEFDSGSHPFTLNGVRTTLSAPKGNVRALFNGSTVTDLVISNPSLVGLSDGSRIFQAINFTGRAIITGGAAVANSRTNTVIDFSDAGNSVSALTVSNIQLRGTLSAPDARITRCNISGIVGDGATSVLPTPSATKIVTNNVFY